VKQRDKELVEMGHNLSAMNERLGTTARRAVEHTVDVDVFIYIRPMNSLTVSDNFEVERCAGHASESRQDRASGTLRIRPSMS
jgi:hypothetical protein